MMRRIQVHPFGGASTSGVGAYALSHNPALGIVPTPLGQQVAAAPSVRPLSLTEAIIASVAVSVISGVISSWFFDRARVPAMVKADVRADTSGAR